MLVEGHLTEKMHLQRKVEAKKKITNPHSQES